MEEDPLLRSYKFGGLQLQVDSPITLFRMVPRAFKTESYFSKRYQCLERYKQVAI